MSASNQIETTEEPTSQQPVLVNKKICAVAQEQFRSTKKWNDIMDSFCTNMPLKRHWRNFRTYSDCFTASDAIDWTYRFLKSSHHFKHLTITRQNAIKVLQIFHKDKLIEDVKGASGSSEMCLKEFQDDDRIFRFCSKNIHYINRVSNNNSNSNSSSTPSALNTATSTTASSNSVVGAITTSASSISMSTNNLTTSISSANQTAEISSSTSSLLAAKPVVETSKQAKPADEDPTATPTNKAFKSSSIDLAAANTSLRPNSMKLSVTETNSSLEREVWVKMARKMLESTLRKAILKTSIHFPLDSRLSGGAKLPSSNISEIEQQSAKILSSSSSSYKNACSTLKRSSDIKINLSKMLDKKSLDVLLNACGAYVQHNCVHVNKHGVVVNTDDDLPIWVIKAMHSLLNWDELGDGDGGGGGKESGEQEEGEEDDDYPKFTDVYQELIMYFKSLSEPLLTKEFSHVFMKILSLLLTQSTETATTNGLKQGSSINTLNKTLKEKNRLSPFPFESSNNKKLCFSQKQLLELVESNVLADLDGFVCGVNNLDDDLETRLLENAKLPVTQLLSGGSVPKSNKQHLLNLIFDSIAVLEHCCDDCLTTYNSLSAELQNTKSMTELDEFIACLNSNSSNNNSNNDTVVAAFFPKSNTFTAELAELAQLSAELVNNQYVNDQDLIDMDNETEDYDDDEEASADLNFFNIHRERNYLLDSDLISFSSIMFPGFNKKNAFPELQSADKLMSDKKMHRNNSFRAAIGTGVTTEINKQEKEEAEEEVEEPSPNFKPILNRKPTPGRPVTRSLTNSSNDFSMNRLKASRFNVQHQPRQHHHYNQLLVTNDNSDEFFFKKPRPVSSASYEMMVKSHSMNFKTSGLLLSPPENLNEHPHTPKLEPRKRKAHAAPLSSSTESLNSTAAANHSNVSIAARGSRFVDPAAGWPNLMQLKSYSTVNIPRELLSSLSPPPPSALAPALPQSSASLSSLNHKAENYSLLSNFSLNELAHVIRQSLNKTTAKTKTTTTNKETADNEFDLVRQQEIASELLILQTEIDKELHSFITSIFRLLTFMLPPSCKRKLHFLLRFLNKLKSAKSTAKHLMHQHQRDAEAAQKCAAYFQQCSRSSNKCIEALIIKSFMHSIVFVEAEKSAESAQEAAAADERLAMKLVQLLISNYSEIMHVPEDLVANVRLKLSVAGKEKTDRRSMHGQEMGVDVGCCQEVVKLKKKTMTNFRSKVSLTELERQNVDTKSHLVNLLDSIVKDVHLSVDEKLTHLKRFKELHPLVFEETLKSKKVLSVLGLNDNADLVNSNNEALASGNELLLSSLSSSSSSVKNKKVFLSNLTNSIKNKNLSNTLNQTTSAFMNTTSAAAKSSIAHTIGLQKFFNKKKKENLI